jgi:hypothetical protein
MCTFCSDEAESLEHLFFQCQYSSELWQTFTYWFEMKTSKTININICTALLGNPNESLLFNHLLVIIKRHIYQCKYAKIKPNFDEVVNRIKFYRSIEKYIYLENEDLFTKKWGILQLI